MVHSLSSFSLSSAVTGQNSQIRGQLQKEGVRSALSRYLPASRVQGLVLPFTACPDLRPTSLKHKALAGTPPKYQLLVPPELSPKLP